MMRLMYLLALMSMALAKSTGDQLALAAGGMASLTPTDSTSDTASLSSTAHHALRFASHKNGGEERKRVYHQLDLLAAAYLEFSDCKDPRSVKALDAAGVMVDSTEKCSEALCEYHKIHDEFGDAWLEEHLVIPALQQRLHEHIKNDDKRGVIIKELTDDIMKKVGTFECKNHFGIKI